MASNTASSADTNSTPKVAPSTDTNSTPKVAPSTDCKNTDTLASPSKKSFFKSLKKKLTSKPPSSFQSPPPSSSNPPKSATPSPPLKQQNSDDSNSSVDQLHDCSFKVATAENSNLKYRQSMEDAHVYIYNFCDVPDAGYFAIFDGHAGFEAAKWCSGNLHKLVQTNILRNDCILPPAPAPIPATPVPKNDPKDKKSKWFSRRISEPPSQKPSSIPDFSMSSVAEANAHAISKLDPPSSTSSLSSDFATMCSNPKLIPKDERVPLAFKSAFLDADSRMAKFIPSHTGTTAAVAVIRWESPDPPKSSEATDSKSTLNSLADEMSCLNPTGVPSEEKSASNTIDSTNSNPPDPACSNPTVTSSAKDTTAINAESTASKPDQNNAPSSPASVNKIPKDTSFLDIPAQNNMNNEAEDDNDTLSDLRTNALRKVRTSNAYPVTAALANDLDGSVPLSKTKTSVSVVSRKSFQHSVVCGNRKRVLYAANVGDSRIVLCRGGRALRLTYDHKGSDEAEQERIVRTGGMVVGNRVNGMLAVTRSLGDGYMKSVVTGFPYTTRTELTPQDEFFIIACDGIWDVITDEQAVSMVRDIMDPKEAGQLLVKSAIDSYSTDNITCMVVRLDPTVCES